MDQLKTALGSLIFYIEQILYNSMETSTAFFGGGGGNVQLNQFSTQNINSFFVIPFGYTLIRQPSLGWEEI